MNFEINDHNFDIAINRLIKLIRRNFKYKVALAIKIVSDESGFSQKELAFELYRLNILKIDKSTTTNIYQNI